MIMSLFQFVVTNISISDTTSATRTTGIPSIHACNAQMGSISVIITCAPCVFIDCAHPLPTSQYPQTKNFLPAIITSVARIIPSGRECLHPYTLSNLDLVTQSF
eukprot:81578_1